MDKVEYLYFIPLLLYGIALNDLFVQFKYFLLPKFRYAPYVITILLFVEMLVFNVYEYFEYAQGMNVNNYFQYMFFLVPPVISMMLVSSTIIKEDAEDIEIAYKDTIRYTYILLAVLMCSRLLPIFKVNDNLHYARAIMIGLALLYAFTKRKAVFYCIVALWAIGVGVRLYNFYGV